MQGMSPYRKTDQSSNPGVRRRDWKKKPDCHEGKTVVLQHVNEARERVKLAVTKTEERRLGDRQLQRGGE